MREQIIYNILNGMTVPFFLTMLIMAFAGVLVFFLTDVLDSVYIDETTPKTWSWNAFIKGFLRLFVGLVILVVSIIYFGELSKMVFRIPDPLEMNGLVAFFIGMGIDAIVKKVLHFGRKPTQYLLHKAKRNGLV